MKTILITGASSGIGEATALYFANKGWKVAATMRNPANASTFFQHDNIQCYALDVTSEESVAKALALVATNFGSIDVLVNNAGFGVDGVFEAMDDATIRHQFETNVFGLMRVTRAVIPYMRQQGGGNIIQIASVGGQVTFPLYQIYHSTKWAVEGFSESLQYELRQFNIKVRIIEPGAVKTAFYGRSRVEVKADTLSEYQAFVDKCNALSQKSGQTGIDAAKVAATVYRAATNTGWRMRYSIGYPAPWIILTKRFLPEWLYLGFVRMTYGI